MDLRIRPYWALFLFVCVFSSGQVQGQDPLPSPLLLRDAVRIAIEKNPSVKMVENEVQIQQASLLDASKRLNPAFTLNAEGWRPFSSDQGPFFQNTETTGVFSYEIETAGRRSLRTRGAGLGGGGGEAGPGGRKR